MNNEYDNHTQLGRHLFGSRAYDRAAREFKAALATQPDDNNARLMLVRCLHHLNRFEEARLEVEIVLQGEPGNADAHYLASFVARKHKDALREIETALALAPGIAHYHERRAYVLARLNRRKEALDSAYRALQIRPEFAGGHRQCAHLLLDLGRRDEAASHVRHALRIDPENPLSHSLQARLKVVDRDFTDAHDEWSESLRLDPNNSYAKYHLRKTQSEISLERFNRYLYRFFWRWIPWPLRLPLLTYALFHWIVFSSRFDSKSILEASTVMIVVGLALYLTVASVLIRNWLQWVPDRFIPAPLRPYKKPPLS